MLFKTYIPPYFSRYIFVGQLWWNTFPEGTEGDSRCCEIREVICFYEIFWCFKTFHLIPQNYSWSIVMMQSWKPCWKGTSVSHCFYLQSEKRQNTSALLNLLLCVGTLLIFYNGKQEYSGSTKLTISSANQNTWLFWTINYVTVQVTVLGQVSMNCLQPIRLSSLNCAML